MAHILIIASAKCWYLYLILGIHVPLLILSLGYLFITGTNYVYLFSDNYNELFINQLGTLCQVHLSCSERLYFPRTNCSATPSV